MNREWKMSTTLVTCELGTRTFLTLSRLSRDTQNNHYHCEIMRFSTQVFVVTNLLNLSFFCDAQRIRKTKRNTNNERKKNDNNNNVEYDVKHIAGRDLKLIKEVHSGRKLVEQEHQEYNLNSEKALVEDADIIVIGAGFAGLGAARALQVSFRLWVLYYFIDVLCR